MLQLVDDMTLHITFINIKPGAQRCCLAAKAQGKNETFHLG